MNFLVELEKAKVPHLQMISIKGTALNRENYKMAEAILYGKGWICSLDTPYNIEIQNAAKG
jgi:hypothetical protein